MKNVNQKRSPKDYGTIGILAGGRSNEREISLRSGRAVHSALSGMGFNAIFLDVNDDAYDIIKHSRPDVAFIALHGRLGENGTVQSILEKERIPYTGSGVSASRLAIDKIASKQIFKKHSLDVPKYVVTDGASEIPEGVEGLSFPVVVKPQCEGSSIGLSVVNEKKDLAPAIREALRYDPLAIIEEYIQGRELTVGILGAEALPVVEIEPRDNVYDFRAKYEDPETRYTVPARLESSLYERARQVGLAAHHSLGCRSLSRVDMILDGNNKGLYVLEVNTIPGMTERSLLPKAALAVGMSFGELCSKLVEMATR
ncbi:MAG: D-alanine--D-alanine ligase [Candidatus Omnitrophota bacterium]